MSQFIGKQHRQLIHDLGNDWLHHGPVVCIVEGFPGTGKTNVLYPGVRERAVASEMRVVKVDVGEPSESQFSDFVLELADGLSLEGIDELTLAIQKSPKPATQVWRALRDVFRAKVLIVVDEFQRALDAGGQPSESFRKLFRSVNEWREAPGRLLAFTDRDPQRDDWAETIRFEELAPLDLDDGLALLEKSLMRASRGGEITVARRADLVRWVGGNPRALELVVGALATTPYDELLGMLPSPGDTRERRVSDALVLEIERKLLLRVTAGLDSPAAQLLRVCSIHRRPVERDGMIKMAPRDTAIDPLIRVLTERFLLRQSEGYYEVNPVAQQVERAALRRDTPAWRAAHSLVADYYLQRFESAGTQGANRLGGDFVEVRYHLVQAMREQDLAPIVRQFEAYLRSEFVLESPGRYQPVARDGRELDEQIAVISILLPPSDLATGGAKSLEFHLARCLDARGRPGDLERALAHSRRSTGRQAPVMSWLLRADLEARLNGAIAATDTIRSAIGYLRHEPGLYLRGAAILTQANRHAAAIELLRQGISAVPETRGQVPLYRAAVDALAHDDEPTGLSQALALVYEGIIQVPVHQNAALLYQTGADLLFRLGRHEEALGLIRKGILNLRSTGNLFVLYQDGAELLERSARVGDALALLREGIASVPSKHNLFSLYRAGAMLLRRAGRPAEALALLQEGIHGLPPQYGVSTLYTTAIELLEQDGNRAEALALARDGIKTVPVERGLHTLYRLAVDLCGRRGQAAEILRLTREANERLAGGDNAQRIQESAIYNLARLPSGSLHLAELGISLASAPAGLALIMRHQLANDWAAAAAAASALRQAYPRNAAVAEHEAFSWLAAGGVKQAREAFDSFSWRNEPGPNWWLGALIDLKSGDSDATRVAWARFRGEAAEGTDVPTEVELIQAWDEPVKFGVPHPKYYHPILPPTLTGREDVVIATPSLSPGPASQPPSSSVSARGARASGASGKAIAPRSLVWLHLSDLHACKEKTGWDAAQVLKPLSVDLKKMERDHGLRPQLLFFTGDAAFGTFGKSTMADQYVEVESFLSAVRTAFDPPISKENVFLVPGNHDVDRAEVAPDQTQWLESEKTDVGQINTLIQDAAKQWQRYMDRLLPFKSFVERHGYAHLLADPNRLVYGLTRDVAGVQIGIGGFNSAWSCGRDKEKGKLWLAGSWQLSAISDALSKADLAIALMHHPYSWFVEHEDPALGPQFERGFEFFLHGHEHTNWVDARADGHVRIAAAACYEHSQRANGYNLVRLDLDSGEGEVWLRRYDALGGGWIPRVIANKTDNDGMWRVDVGARLKKRRGAA